MPVLPGSQQYSPTLQQIAQQMKSNPDFYNVLGGAPGYTTEPFLTIANEVMSRILAENMPWKWNRKIIPPFLTVSLQQDYCTQITDIGWLENAWIVDINNSTSNSNGAPKPIRSMETVRDLVWTSGHPEIPEPLRRHAGAAPAPGPGENYKDTNPCLQTG